MQHRIAIVIGLGVFVFAQAASAATVQQKTIPSPPPIKDRTKAATTRSVPSSPPIKDSGATQKGIIVVGGKSEVRGGPPIKTSTKRSVPSEIRALDTSQESSGQTSGSGMYWGRK